MKDGTQMHRKIENFKRCQNILGLNKSFDYGEEGGDKIPWPEILVNPK